MNSLSAVIMMAIWFGMFYLILLFLNKRKSKKYKNMVDSLKLNDTVITVGGIKATVANVLDGFIELKIDNKGTRITVKKSAISHVLNKN